MVSLLMTYEQFISAYDAAPGATSGLLAIGVSIAIGLITGHLTRKALRNSGGFRRWFGAIGSGLIAFVFAVSLLFLLAQTLDRGPLVQEHPEYAERYLERLREEGNARVAAVEADRRATSRDPAVEACADTYRYNTNSADPDEWERTHDVGAGRKRATMRLDGSPALHEGQQVYTVVIPRNGETVRFDRNGMYRDGSGCQMFQDPDTGGWRSTYGL